jgi:hypothetical protein
MKPTSTRAVSNPFRLVSLAAPSGSARKLGPDGRGVFF